MFTINYYNEQCNEAFERAMALSEQGNYADAHEAVQDAIYYCSILLQSLQSQERNAALRRFKTLQSIAAELERKAACVRFEAPSAAHTSPAPAAAQTTPATESPYITFIPADKIKVTFDDVVGLDEAKSAVNEYIIYPQLYPEHYTYDYMPNKGILLLGPPGTGKTTFAKAVAHEINQPFALVSMSALINCYVGETSKHVDEMFGSLRAYAANTGNSLTVFFDEFDEIAKRRGSDDKASEAAVPALLRNLDGMLEDAGFLIMANTNHLEMLDPAIVDRFSRRIEIPLPDFDSRVTLFRKRTYDLEPVFSSAIDWEAAARLSDGMSGRDIAFICDGLKRFLSKLKAGVVASRDINVELANIIRQRRLVL